MPRFLRDETVQRIEESGPYLTADIVLNWIGYVGSAILIVLALRAWWSHSFANRTFWFRLLIVGLLLLIVRHAKDMLFAWVGLAPPDYRSWFNPEHEVMSASTSTDTMLHKLGRAQRIQDRGMYVDDMLKHNETYRFVPRRPAAINRQKDLVKRIRWAALLPLAIGAYFATIVIAVAIIPHSIDSDVWLQFIGGVLAPCALVIAGLELAPSHRMPTAISLTIVAALYSIYLSADLIRTQFVTGPLVFWTILWRTVGIVCIVCICYSQSKGSNAKASAKLDSLPSRETPPDDTQSLPSRDMRPHERGPSRSSTLSITEAGWAYVNSGSYDLEMAGMFTQFGSIDKTFYQHLVAVTAMHLSESGPATAGTESFNEFIEENLPAIRFIIDRLKKTRYSVALSEEAWESARKNRALKEE
jgi:hypothetical protein